MVATRLAIVRHSSAAHSGFTTRRALCSSSPVVFRLSHSAPCIVSATSATRPPITVYQSRIPGATPGLQLVHSGKKKYPSACKGTPRSTLASAAPKKIVSSKLASPNTPSSSVCHTPMFR